VAAAKEFDSLEPSLSVDPNYVPTERNDLAPPCAANVQLVSADPRLEVQIVGGTLITILSYVPDDGPFDASLALNVDGNFVTASLHKGMSSEDVVNELDRRMPPGYGAELRDGSLSDVLIVTVLRPQVPANTSIDLRFLSTDPSQLFRWAGKNKLRIEGRSSKGLRPRPHLAVHLDGYLVRLPLGSADPPLTTALRLRDALPKRYGALVELPVSAGGDVSLTILRRR
jgi:hypothetical protein